jgi:hypothetical protein
MMWGYAVVLGDGLSDSYCLDIMAGAIDYLHGVHPVVYYTICMSDRITVTTTKILGLMFVINLYFSTACFGHTRTIIR